MYYLKGQLCKDGPVQARGKPTLVHQCHLLSLTIGEAHPRRAVLKIHNMNIIMSIILFTCTADIFIFQFYIFSLH